MTQDMYHYTESGLDNIWLSGGVERVDRPSGQFIKIKDIEGLHRVIGRLLIEKKENLIGKEIRFIRQELNLSQSILAGLLGVAEQTVLRWEKGKAEIPKSSEALIRFMYKQIVLEEKLPAIKDGLQKLANFEDHMDGQRITVRRPNNKWQADTRKAA